MLDAASFASHLSTLHYLAAPDASILVIYLMIGVMQLEHMRWYTAPNTFLQYHNQNCVLKTQKDTVWPFWNELSACR